MRLRIGLALVVVLALTLGACSDDDDKSNGTTTTTSTTVPATGTTTPPTSPPSTAAPTTTSSSLSPQQCAQALFDAWAEANQSAAPSCASAGAVQQIFSEPYASGYQGPNCNGAAGSVFCTWTNGPTVLTMEVRNTTGGLPVEVISVNRMGAGT
jgi:hypothetical protein